MKPIGNWPIRKIPFSKTRTKSHSYQHSMEAEMIIFVCLYYIHFRTVVFIHKNGRNQEFGLCSHFPLIISSISDLVNFPTLISGLEGFFHSFVPSSQSFPSANIKYWPSRESFPQVPLLLMRRLFYFLLRLNMEIS